MMECKTAFDFNKQLVMGEFGALLGAPFAAIVMSYLTDVASIISFFAVVGAIAGASLFWLIIRVYDHKRQNIFSVKDLACDLAWFTPVAFLLTLTVYYPSLFFISRYLIVGGSMVFTSVFASQLIAFLAFLLAINIYRALLVVLFNKRL